MDPERVKADKNKLVFYNVSEFDKMTIQCNSTNKHGYIYENAYLNIQSEFHQFTFIGQCSSCGCNILIDTSLFSNTQKGRTQMEFWVAKYVI